MLISIEIMLLAVTLLIILSSFSFDDILGQTYGIYIIAIAGAESAIGLGILVAYYRLRATVAGFLGRKIVTGDNYLVMFIGWEGVGISSYLLINFWFTRLQANKAAIKALVMNRVGDWGFSIGLWAIFWTFGNLDFTTVFSLAPFINEELITIISICLLVAAMGKSAQIGLHTWLPDAMEGPTPVSALIHAATMVTAGVYLLLRSSPILEFGSTALILITWVGALTAFFAATTGLLQNDLKRVIAYSTCSQLGLLFLVCGLSQYNVALFHLVNHAWFKALLFLSAGSVIHAMNDEQDLRKFGGLSRLLPFTYSMMI
ncbi:hypothetical protein G6F57_023889 (mitochondrion) [Rhizopus arrhizus]|uniref:NADH:quinone oxidoreductase/Mrp antiporter transmembrane domain-containing protein n=1 Tax=Rhizopus oryzae TaxID=64495 RepID=A0A9P6WRT5_RHIOR|nr:hypothetical protein G6F20_014253 [Rhizopus arrhizus]KAG0861261.1 hypothetical protein G6F17_000257 [Rhizopus arrhizus]KAG0879245.1 hypothetical protein G6F16_000309 [Rhizopus arrhizus]KAG0904179.1 hypothetical protein G6F34_000415 [Rhizopus arrhizus]KAG0958827.1 hypothetical protein G6F28_014388 [Rhizopus arrhizus]